MIDKYKYEIKEGCFNVMDTEKNTSRILSNFTVKIIAEEHYFVDANGEAKIFYHLEGETQAGDKLPHISVSMEDYDKGKWFRTKWGGKAELNDIDGHRNALKHFLRAIFESSSPIPSESVYERTGFVIDPSGKPKFLFSNGAVTVDGIDSTNYCNLPKRLELISLPKHMQDEAKINEAIKVVFNLLSCSEKNPVLGSMLCLTAIRATISSLLPIEQFIFLIGPKGAFERSIAEVIQSFFGATRILNPVVSWDLPSTELESHAHSATNAVLVVEDFVYPDISNRRHDFSVKVDKFLLALSKGLPISRGAGAGLKTRTELNCLVVSTGAFAPREIAESLHEHGIYVPFSVDDITDQELATLVNLAKDGTFAQANVAFIQYLLADYQKKTRVAKKLFERSIKINKHRFNLDDRAVTNMAGFIVGLITFCKFAVSKGIITEVESKGFVSLVKQQLGKLFGQQKNIYSSNPGQLFIKGLRQALKNGKAYLIDSQTGEQPDKILPSKVGWRGEEPNGLWIGWRDAKTGSIFIRGDIDTELLINLLPEHDQSLFSKGVNKFWKDLKADCVLECNESDRNTTRQVFARAKTTKNYHLKMVITRSPKASKTNSKQKPLDNATANKE